MDTKEVKLAVLKLVMQSGSEMDRSNPLTKADELFKWVTTGDNNTTKRVASKRTTKK